MKVTPVHESYCSTQKCFFSKGKLLSKGLEGVYVKHCTRPGFQRGLLAAKVVTAAKEGAVDSFGLWGGCWAGCPCTHMTAGAPGKYWEGAAHLQVGGSQHHTTIQ